MQLLWPLERFSNGITIPTLVRETYGAEFPFDILATVMPTRLAPRSLQARASLADPIINVARNILVC